MYDIIRPRRRRTQFHRTTDGTHSSHMLQFHFWNVNNTNAADSVASSRCRLDKSDVRSHVRRYFITPLAQWPDTANGLTWNAEMDSHTRQRNIKSKFYSFDLPCWTGSKVMNSDSQSDHKASVLRICPAKLEIRLRQKLFLSIIFH